MDFKFQGLQSKGETGIIAWAAKKIMSCYLRCWGD